jgi:hypothetical protein
MQIRPGTWYEEQRAETAATKQKEIQKTIRKTLGLEIGKRAVEIFNGLQKMKNWTLWRGQPPPKQKKIK